MASNAYVLRTAYVIQKRPDAQLARMRRERTCVPSPSCPASLSSNSRRNSASRGSYAAAHASSPAGQSSGALSGSHHGGLYTKLGWRRVRKLLVDHGDQRLARRVHQHVDWAQVVAPQLEGAAIEFGVSQAALGGGLAG